MKPNKIIFIHGNGAMHWSFAWTPWLKVELTKLNIHTTFETFPDSILARKQYWLSFLKDYLKADEHSLLIGWSSGAVAALRYAEYNKVWGSILIAPCYTDLGLESEKISGFYDEPWNWQKIKKHQQKIALFYSKNDELIPQIEFQHIKKQLQPDEVCELETNGHFIHQETFPEIVACVKKFINGAAG
ncbi:MAG: alpha/beta hydrolase [Candidatus Abawacabacteria bacterium]|nr:alpha/beta hydrolase [Candidatus Abawacabacteria bacterium]